MNNMTKLKQDTHRVPPLFSHFKRLCMSMTLRQALDEIAQINK